MRVTFGDIWKYSIEDNVWTEITPLNTKIPKRMHAASCVLGGVWIIHGGNSGSNREIFNDITAFDLNTRKFGELICSGKVKIQDKIGPLSMHTAVCVLPEWLTQRADNVKFWTDYHKWHFSAKDPLTSEKMGMYIIGGMINEFEYNQNIYHIRVNSERVTSLMQGDPPRYSPYKYYVEVDKIQVDGPAPLSRALHTALFYKKYIVIFGGKNDKDPDLSSFCLNDLCFFDLDDFKWQIVIVYGFIPSGRWGQAMGIQNDTLVIFGGVTESRLCSSTVYALEFEHFKIRNNLLECQRIGAELESEGKRFGFFSQYQAKSGENKLYLSDVQLLFIIEF